MILLILKVRSKNKKVTKIRIHKNKRRKQNNKKKLNKNQLKNN